MNRLAHIHAITSVIALFFVGSLSGVAETVYSVDFTNKTSNTSIDTFGWKAFRDNGTDYSSSTSDPFKVLGNSTSSYVFSSSGTDLNTNFAITYEIGSLDPAQYWNDLTLSFEENTTDAGDDGDVFWRAIVRTGGDIFVSHLLPASATRITWNLNLSDEIWYPWTGETDFSDGFAIAGIGSTAANLPVGIITEVGVLIDDGNDNNDRQRLYNFSITGTVLVDTDGDELDDNWEVLHFRESPEETVAAILAKYGGSDDPDNDTYDNAAEQAAGTDPSDIAHTPFDADRDGYEDAWEIASFGTTEYGPSDDPDGDTYSIADELAAGTDPADAESNPFYQNVTSTTPGVIHGHPADVNVREDGTFFGDDADTLLQGGRGSPAIDLCTVLVFQLPDFGAQASPFENARLEFRLESVVNQPKPSDLYGLGSRDLPDVLLSDYYGQTTTPDPSDASQFQTNILTVASSPGKILTNLPGSVALTNYLNSQYAGGAGAGRYVFLRLSTNTPVNGVHRHIITSAEGAVSNRAASGPLIRYNFPVASMSRPFIWVRENEKPAILDKIANHRWAMTVRDGIVDRVAPALASHQADRDAFIRELPVHWSASPATFKTIPAYSESEVRDPTTEKFDAAIDCAVLYYLTGDTSYAECAADILHNAIQTLIPVAPSTYVGNGGWIFQNDLLKGARVVGNQLPVVYDFLHDYLESNQVYDVQTGGQVDFQFEDAQTVFRTWYRLTRDHGQYGSNWSALMSNCMLQNLLALDDEEERDAALEVYLKTGSSRQRSLAADHDMFTDAGDIWPESLSYAMIVNQIRSNHMMMLERIYPELDLMTPYGAFPTNLQRISQFTFPNNKRVMFGDMPRGSGGQPYFEYEMVYQQALRRGSLGLAADYGGRLQAAIEDGIYSRFNLRSYSSLGMHNEPLQLLWQAPTIDAAPVVQELPRTDHLPFAGVSLQRNLSTTGNSNYGLMGFVGGGSHIHSHASGMSMELYGAGYVMGSKGGTSSYQSRLHEDYYRVFASNNTIITNGASRGQGNWEGVGINTVQNVAMEPQPFEEGVSDHYSFTISAFDDDKGTLSEAEQERTLAIVRTSPTSGFYVDVFRSKTSVTSRTATTLDGPVTDQYHDYIYRNIGEPVIGLSLDGAPLSMSSQPDRFANDIGDSYSQPGWRYFENVQVSHPETGSLRARFTVDINDIVRHMDMHMPAVAAREYAQVESPRIINAPSPYTQQKAATMVIRQIGEAWDNAFAAVYEPSFESDGATIQAVETLEQGGVVRGVRVTSLVDGETQIHHIITQPGANDTFEDPTIGLSFTGRFGIATLLADNTVRLYVGEGSSMSYRGNTTTGTDPVTQFEATFAPNAEPTIVANSSVTSSIPRPPAIEAFARHASGQVSLSTTLTPGTPYRVQSSPTLLDGSWTDETSGIAPDGAIQIQLPNNGESQCFFRIVSP